MHSVARRIGAVLIVLAVLPSVASAQAAGRSRAAGRAIVAVEPKYVFEIEGGAGVSLVDKQKWSGTISPLDDWNTTAYVGGGRLLFARFGALRLGAEAGYHYFWWYTTSAAGYPITREPHATAVGPVVRASLGPRLALDGGAAAYLFPGGTDLGVNGALGYFVPAGRRWSLPVKVRADVVFDASTTLLAVVGLVGVSYRF